ncbi:Phage portal protein, SPP1 Gp6-like [Paraburkholderia fungorum]|uniref:Phage portal protein, SPP1 Gp6-like n=1 Tax=Paraburkholderia fungorum TaxID=134537 RepID=A0A1H1IIV0_9BURK|nr:phage portal protein [Paraburkholderia fungorum]SDR37574.1 Phage portal protein, SPP1 Gp6-like [Paraburkholderia fungorum]
MFKTLQKDFPRDKDFPDRTFRLQVLQRVLDGTIYDELKHAFDEEQNDAQEYIPLRKRRPCVRSNLCRTVVDDSVSLLFSEGHFPSVELKDEEQKLALHRLIKESKLNELMIDATSKGSVGSVAILFRVLEKRVFFEVMGTDYLTPRWNPRAPDTLLDVTEKYKVSGSALVAQGYEINAQDLGATFWFQRVWSDGAESWFVPWKVSDENQVPALDKDKTVKHELGFVPVVWVKNLPGGDAIDGKPTFPNEAIDTQIEIDYQLSQAGRGLKYTSDPTLLIKEPAYGENGPAVKGAANAIKVGAEGDAKLLEINGTGAAAVLEYVKHLREIALETMHGNQTSPEKMSSAQSGRAMELMQQALVNLADRLRISYGEGALGELLCMIAKASQLFKLTFKDGDPVGKIDHKSGITLRWPAWFAPTMSDMMNRATTLHTLCNSALLSRETAIKILAAEYDIEDVKAEKLLADADMALRNAAAQVQAKINE